jgi:hypothetical protein
MHLSKFSSTLAQNLNIFEKNAKFEKLDLNQSSSLKSATL